jgi:hypothetical protein
MAHFLRKINANNWSSLDWLSEGSAPGDCIADLNSKGCTLSFWRSETDEDIEKIIVALAANKDDFDKVELAKVSEEYIFQLGIDIENTEGETPYTAANLLHVSFNGLTSQKIHMLALTIYENKSEIRKHRAEVKQLVINVIGEIDQTKIKGKILKYVTDNIAI